MPSWPRRMHRQWIICTMELLLHLFGLTYKLKQSNNNQQQHQCHFETCLGWRGEGLSNFITPETSLLSYDSAGNSGAGMTGPWFLTIFMNMLPWESVLRVWDVLLFHGNRVMLFKTALALLEFYGPALVTTKDAGDAVISH